MRGCFLFVHIGLRLPRLRIGKCPTAFFVYIGFVIGRKPSFWISLKNRGDSLEVWVICFRAAYTKKVRSWYCYDSFHHKILRPIICIGLRILW